MKRRMYHVSPRRVMESIRKTGIDPAYSQTARYEVWVCDLFRVGWAVEHVAARHNCPIDEVVAYSFMIDDSKLVNRGGGRFTTEETITRFTTIRKPRR